MGVLIKNEFYKLKREWFMVFLLLLSLLPIITGPDVKFCVSVFRQKSRMAQESRADSGLNPLVTENHSGQNGMRAAPA